MKDRFLLPNDELPHSVVFCMKLHGLPIKHFESMSK